MKQCDKCAMCCKLLPIPEPEIIAKDGNTWCVKWSAKTGCSIYADRPEVCQKFYCAWILDDNLPDELRPDKCRVVMFFKDGKLIVVSETHDAWRQNLIGSLLEVYPEPYSVYIGSRKLCDVS